MGNMKAVMVNLNALLSNGLAVTLPTPVASQILPQPTTSASPAEKEILPADVSEEIRKLTNELNHLNLNGIAVNLDAFKEDIQMIKNGVHDIKMYYAPPVQDQNEEDASVTTYKIGDFHFPLKTVQEIFELDKALKNDLQRNDNNQDVAKFFMSIVSPSPLIFSSN